MNARRLRAVAPVLLAAALGIGAPAGAQDLEHAKKIVSGRCFLCHGAEGESSTELYARLAGQHPAYLEKQLKDFRDGRRKGGGMEQMAADLKDDEIRWLGVYFSTQKAAPFPATDRVLASTGRSLYEFGSPAAGVPACISCHGANGQGAGLVPRLAGQLPVYTMRQLKQFARSGRAKDALPMHLIAGKLSDLEIKAIAEYLGELE